MFPVALIIVVFGALGFIQIIFQSDMTKTLKQSEKNFREMVQTQLIMNQTLAVLSTTAPQSNFTAQAEAIRNIEYLIDAVDDIKRILNESKVTG